MRVPGMVDKDALVRAKAIQSLSEGLPTMLQQDALLLQSIVMNLKARCSFQLSTQSDLYFFILVTQCITQCAGPFHKTSG